MKRISFTVNLVDKHIVISCDKADDVLVLSECFASLIPERPLMVISSFIKGVAQITVEGKSGREQWRNFIVPYIYMDSMGINYFIVDNSYVPPNLIPNERRIQEFYGVTVSTCQ